jgi:hypothetical protein
MSTIAALSEFPLLLQLAVNRTPEAQWQTRARDGSFALVEHAWHLADLEQEGFNVRIRRLLGEADPQLPDFPGAELARERRYIKQLPAPAVARFQAARAENLRRLKGVSGEQWLRRGTQDGVGELSLGRIPAMMLEHDHTHAHELVALLGELKVAIPKTLATFAALQPLARSA